MFVISTRLYLTVYILCSNKRLNPGPYSQDQGHILRRRIRFDTTVTHVKILRIVTLSLKTCTLISSLFLHL